MLFRKQAGEEWEAAGGADAEKRVSNVLNGLGFTPEDQSKKCSEFSGGWQVLPTHHIVHTVPLYHIVHTALHTHHIVHTVPLYHILHFLHTTSYITGH